jgi:hypothetical protein
MSLCFFLGLVLSPNLRPPTPMVREPTPAVQAPSLLAWQTDYGVAFGRAKKSQRQLLIYFYDDQPNAACRQFEAEALADPGVQRLLAKCVLLRLPLGVTTTTGTTVHPVAHQVAHKMLEHESLAEMHRMPGIVIVELAHPLSPDYGYVVSQLPFQPKKYFQRTKFHSIKSVRTLLQLPTGSLTQRTMIYAVRMQHETPLSTKGRCSEDLSSEARKHSQHQASIQLQGHHNWQQRFSAINARLADDLIPIEVCAESWPNENLVEAAVECVYSWRRSAGHWKAVSAYHPEYGYDMRRGSNGIWYATGIFAKQRAP